MDALRDREFEGGSNFIEQVCVCVREREPERDCVHVCERESEREIVCVCV